MALIIKFIVSVMLYHVVWLKMHATEGATTKAVCGTHLVTQCAAVRTHCVPMRAPPQRYWFSELMSATCQHHSAGSPSSPPTTRLCLSRLRAVPFTPHTYLLYTGGRVVVEPPSGGPAKLVLLFQNIICLLHLLHKLYLCRVFISVWLGLRHRDKCAITYIT
jgi:hypothetical protein